MSYIGAEPDGMGKAQRFTYTSASGGETVVSADDDGIPIGYTSGQVSVFLNGVKLVVGTDCIATNGSTITGLAALAASDVVEVVALSIFSATTVEGADIISTGETGTTKYLRVDGDGTSSWQTITEYNDNVIQTNIALLGFKVAVNGSLAKYNLQDQIVDEFVTNAGIDASASTNEYLSSSGYLGKTDNSPTGGDSTDTSISGYTTLVFTTSRALTVVASGNVSILVVGGGGSGGSDYGGGAGAGGLVYKATHGLTANTYDAVIGAGGAAETVDNAAGNTGVDTTWTINGGSQEFIGKGGGGGGGEDATGNAGGSAGGGSYTKAGGTNNQSDQSGDSDVGAYGFGTNGGLGNPMSGVNERNTGGGGGAGGAGANGTSGGSGTSGAGGIGKDYSAVFGTALGDSGWFASGGGGGDVAMGTHAAGTASNGGGTAGGTSGGNSSAAQANTGGGSGGGASSAGTSGAGGSGVVLVRFDSDDFITNYVDLTLQSNDTTAEAVPTTADMVMLIEDAGSGVATINTHIKGWISRDSGTTFTQGTLVDEGSWGTSKKILAFHDLNISAQPSGVAMCYKITTHSASAVYDTKIHATSIGWR